MCVDCRLALGLLGDLIWILLHCVFRWLNEAENNHEHRDVFTKIQTDETMNSSQRYRGNKSNHFLKNNQSSFRAPPTTLDDVTLRLLVSCN